MDIFKNILHFSDQVVFVQRSYLHLVCSYLLLVYNPQLFAKIFFCLDFFVLIHFVLNLSSRTDDVIRDVADDVMRHDLISYVSHHLALKTNVSHPHPHGQTTRVQTAVHTRSLSKLTYRWHTTRGGLE